jgi:hypothetical protein
MARSPSLTEDKLYNMEIMYIDKKTFIGPGGKDVGFVDEKQWAYAEKLSDIIASIRTFENNARNRDTMRSFGKGFKL